MASALRGANTRWQLLGRDRPTLRIQNPGKPIFRFAGVTVTGVKIFGKNKEHIELTVQDEGKTMSVISFFSASEPWVTDLYGKQITFTATLDESNFGGRTLYRMRLNAIE